MSHKHHNYTNYSKPQTAPVEPVVEDDTVVPVIEEVVEEVVEATEPEIEEAVEEVTEVIGVVTDCVKLNVRKAPNATAEIICTIPLGTEVMIDEDKSTGDFYAICTEAGVEGYCMKKFINTNS